MDMFDLVCKLTKTLLDFFFYKQLSLVLDIYIFFPCIINLWGFRPFFWSYPSSKQHIQELRNDDTINHDQLQHYNI